MDLLNPDVPIRSAHQAEQQHDLYSRGVRYYIPPKEHLVQRLWDAEQDSLKLAFNPNQVAAMSLWRDTFKEIMDDESCTDQVRARARKVVQALRELLSDEYRRKPRRGVLVDARGSFLSPELTYVGHKGHLIVLVSF